MLYVFYVDTGTMLEFDMNYALDNVSCLMNAIEQKIHIPIIKQVLLVSGGVSLESTSRVCMYSAGTDTNPIFLFGKGEQDAISISSPSIGYGIDQDLKVQVEASQTLEANYNSVVVRTQLAQQFHQVAVGQIANCKKLVHEQHLMQQGWAAAIANLEDVSSYFRNHTEQLEKVFNNFLQSREQYTELLKICTEDEDILGKIPLVPALQEWKDGDITTTTSLSGLKNEISQQKFESNASTSVQKENCDKRETEATKSSEITNGSGDSMCSGSLPFKPLTLLQWIQSKDKKSNIQNFHADCRRNMEQINVSVLERFGAEAKKALDAASRPEMKEIKGLGDRLSGLDQLMEEAQRIVQEQRDVSLSLYSNQTRMSSCKDLSILPDLCSSHQRQLDAMLRNHIRLCDIVRRCSRAKHELSDNLLKRRVWVEYVENCMSNIRQKYFIKYEMIKHVQKCVDIVQQIHLAPTMYLNAISEIVRRRIFSESFLKWANELSSQILSIHKEEVARRQDFQNKFQGHFLNTLFPGLEDMPSAFAMKPPAVFDSNLPKLTIEDIELLRSQLTDLNIPLPDVNSFTTFFGVKSVLAPSNSHEAEEHLDKEVVPETTETASTQLENVEASTSKPTSISVHTPAPSKEVDKGFESETDTEEFEKVGQSPVKLASCEAVETVPANAGLVNQVSSMTTLEENLGNTRNEVERLRAHLVMASRLAADTMCALREDLATLRAVAGSQQEELDGRSKELMSILVSHQTSVEAAEEVRQTEECRLVQRLTVDHELEMDSLKQEVKNVVEAKEEDIRQLKKDVEIKEQELAMLRADMERRLEEEVTTRSVVVQTLESRLADMRQQISQMQCQLDGAGQEKQQAIHDVQERLTHEYKTELESLRSRFRLMTMERSPSDSSLERIERPDMIELVNHEAIVQELRNDLEVQMEVAIKQAVLKERTVYETRLEQELKQARLRSEAERQIWFNEAMRRAIEEKERQVETLRSREQSLLAECTRQQDIICSLTDGSYGRGSLDSKINKLSLSQLMYENERLKADKRKMESELAQEYARKTRTLSETAVSDNGDEPKGAAGTEMSLSVAVVQEANGSRDVATSPDLLQRGICEERLREKLTQSTTSLIQQGKISIVSCGIGDAVLVLWDEEYKNYIILQESPTLYFLHFDCLHSLGLRPSSDEASRRRHCVGEVIEKEYCHAKKPENRYRVPKGTKFYRVKVRPLQKELLLVRSHYQKQKQQQSHHETYHKQKQSQKEMLQLELNDDLQGTRKSKQDQKELVQEQTQQKQNQKEMCTEEQSQQEQEEQQKDQEKQEEQQQKIQQECELKQQQQQQQQQQQEQQQQEDASATQYLMETSQVVKLDTAK